MNQREACSALFWMLFGIAIALGVFFGFPLVVNAIELLKGICQ